MIEDKVKKTSISVLESVWKQMKRRALDENAEVQALVDAAMRAYLKLPPAPQSTHPSTSGNLLVSGTGSTIGVEISEIEDVARLLSVVRSTDAESVDAIRSNLRVFFRGHYEGSELAELVRGITAQRRSRKDRKAS